MKEIIQDIRCKINSGVYQSEEHVRICIVARILQKLGWDIWNPEEVWAEYKTNPQEDSKRVDFALFTSKKNQCIYVEIKSLGLIREKREESEKQLRDYNKDLTAVISILTDGQSWRLYFSQSGGDFAEKCFKVLDLVEDELEDIEEDFKTFLFKNEVAAGRAETEARNYLHLSQQEKVMGECLSKARQMLNQPPYPNLPSALVEQVQEIGFECTIEEATEFIDSESARPQPVQSKPTGNELFPPRSVSHPAPTDHAGTPVASDRREVPASSPPSLKHAKLELAHIGNQLAKNWKGLHDLAIFTALERGIKPQEIQSFTRVRLDEDGRLDSGFCPLEGTLITVQGMDSNNCYRNAYDLAKKMRIELKVEFRWRDKVGAQYPGRRGVIHYIP